MKFLENKSPVLMIALASLLGTTACSFDVPTKFSSEKLQVVQVMDQDVFATDNLTKSTVENIAANHLGSFDDEVDVTVTYDPQSSVNTKSKAEISAKRIGKYFYDVGVDAITTNVLPVLAPPNHSVTTLRYTNVSAQVSDDCGLMPGYKNREDVGSTDIHKDYEYGCTYDSLLARQVANPSDLLGRDGFETPASGRQAQNKISESSRYSPTPASELTGETASGN